jgi:large subunit ribosomal protein L10
MPNAEKTEKIEALKGRIQGSDALLLAEYRGLTVHDATELRRSLEGQARFSVTKNTLLRRAASEAGIEGLDELLRGPTAVAFVEGDVVATAKKLAEAAKRFPALVLKGAYMEGRVLSGDEAKALADLEPRDVMLSRIAGMLKAEMSAAASMFQALQGRFVGLMEALRDKLPGEAEAEPMEGTEPAEPTMEAGSAEEATSEEATSLEPEPAAEATDASPPDAEQSHDEEEE